LIQSVCEGAQRYGVGAGASHLVNGHSAAHHHSKKRLAAFTGFPQALLFSTGYMANTGVVTALAGREDAVFADKLNHASLNDAALLSRALNSFAIRISIWWCWNNAGGDPSAAQAGHFRCGVQYGRRYCADPQLIAHCANATMRCCYWTMRMVLVCSGEQGRGSLFAGKCAVHSPESRLYGYAWQSGWGIWRICRGAAGRDRNPDPVGAQLYLHHRYTAVAVARTVDEFAIDRTGRMAARGYCNVILRN
jgi:hypothetical protein